MAYKFQVGEAIMSGALTQEGDVDLLDSGNLKINATTVISSTRAIQNALTVSGSSTLSGLDLVLAPGKTIGVAGDTDLITLNKDTGIAVAGLVSGTTGGFLSLTSKGLNAQAGGISNAGAIAGATTIDATGLASLDGGIDVNGNATISTAGAVAGVTTLEASGLASLDGGIDVNGNMTVSTAGAVAGATTISGSGLATVGSFSAGQGILTVDAVGVLSGTVLDGTVLAGTEMTSQGPVSGSGVGSFGSLVLDGAANLQSAGITNAGSIAGATTVTATGLGTFGSVSGSGNFDCGGKLEVNGGVEFHSIDPDANYAQATDGLYYYNADDGELKVTTNDAFLNAIAGAGLTVVDNQLESTAGSTTPNEFKPGDAVLIEGFNYATGSADSFTARLPAVGAANLGDKVQIKAGPLAAGKVITIQGHASTPSHTIDGGASVLLESPRAAITCVYAASGSWYVL